MQRNDVVFGKGSRLFVISAPSGCGKGTILGEFMKEHDVFLSVSCTTRAPRDGEINGKHYHFITDEKFDEMIAQDGFLEYAEYTDCSYGTPLAPLLENLAAGRDVFLEIETQGAFKVKEQIPEAVMLFVLPPSVESLKHRLKKRGTEEKDKIVKRVAAAIGEIRRAYDYEYVMMNDDLEEAVRDFTTIYESVKNGTDAVEQFNSKNESIIRMIDEVLENA